jgi:lipopolysaccharide export system protein LptA
MQRVIRIVGSLAIVVIAYWAYALLAVRWIEPSVDPNSAPTVPIDPDTGIRLVKKQMEQLQGLFAPDAWELKNPKILESETNNAKLLLDDYKNLGDGQMAIPRCTIVFSPPGPVVDEAQHRRQSVILEAPHGAVLRFDRPLDLSRAMLGRLVGGTLKGPVTIRSDWKEPGPEDDLLITAAGDLQLAEQTVSTPSPVDFRWGPHFGRGQDMVIKLLAGQPRSGKEEPGPNVAGIESFELRHIERLHLDLGQTASPPGGKPGSVPVEINCRGPFRFDVVGHVATFRDRVEVMKANPSGPSDQLSCELLSLYFVQRPKGPSPQVAAKSDPKATESLDLTVQRIEACGNPAVLTAPGQNRNIIARGEKLEYNLQANSMALDGRQEVFLQQGPNEIHARSIHYEASAANPGRLGRVVAQGPGWFHGLSPDRPDQQLEAMWKDKLRVFPDEHNQVISLTGGAELKFQGAKFQGVGQLQAREIFFWLREGAPVAKNQPAPLRPDRMRALHDVHMNSPQLSSKVDDLQIWFEEGGQTPGTMAEQTLGGPQNNGQPVAQPIGLAVQSPAGLTPPVGAAVSAPPQAAAPPQPPTSQRFEVVGRLFQARVALGQQQATVSKMTIEDGVQFLETQTAQPGERPLIIRGDKLEGTGVTAPQAQVRITGRPARFEGRGLGMTGSNINLDRGANRVWIDGPGQMDVPFSDNQQGQAPAAPGVLTVDWQRSMVFDGLRVRFDHAVVAATTQWQIHTEAMEVQLLRPIRFSEPNGQDRPQVEEIHGLDGVWLENRSFDPQRQLISHDQLQLSDIVLNAMTGAMNGGPGWLNSVRRGSDNPLGGPMVAMAGGGPPAAVPMPQDSLSCLHVRFQKSITGNFWAHRVSFDDRVQTVYAPVDNWDAVLTTDNLEQLGPRAVTLRCNRLSVAEMLLPIGGPRSFQVWALDNTVVESNTFTALAQRITYDSAKDLLILSGDGLSNAELYRQSQVGGERDHNATQTIYYHPRSNKMGSASGAQSVEITLPPGGNGKR